MSKFLINKIFKSRMILGRIASRTQSDIYDGDFIEKIVGGFYISYPLIRTHPCAYQGLRNVKAVNYFSKKSPSWMFGWVLNTGLLGVLI